ncbi:MAG: hypothetical protein GXO65_01310 [Euryarchaeota archaeon]|nr:hypothetical protein [Euryarchaeota archaeon]
MNCDYICWRISGTLERSIESCPEGSPETCLSQDVGETCPLGKTIRL